MIPAQTIDNEQLSDLRHEIETSLTELFLIQCLAKDCPAILEKINKMSIRLNASIETPVDDRAKAGAVNHWLDEIEACKSWLYCEDTQSIDFKSRLSARLHLSFAQEEISNLMQIRVIEGDRQRKRGRPKKTKLVMVK